MQDEKAGHADERLVHEVVGRAVAHLVDGEVVGPRALPGRELGMMVQARGGGDAVALGGGLIVEDVDRVARDEQGQDVRGVVGDARGRGRNGREEGEPLHRRAISTYSCGP